MSTAEKLRQEGRVEGRVEGRDEGIDGAAVAAAGVAGGGQVVVLGVVEGLAVVVGGIAVLLAAQAARLDPGIPSSNWLPPRIEAAQALDEVDGAVVLDASGINDLDATGAEMLDEVIDELRDNGVSLHLADVKGPVRDVLLPRCRHRDPRGPEWSDDDGRDRRALT